MNDAAARTLSVTFAFIVKYLHPQYTIRNYILNASKEMMIKRLQSHRVKLKDSNVIVVTTTEV